MDNNPFSQINKPLLDVPQELKVRVMKDIAMSKLLMELASLFSLNVGNVVQRTIKKRKNKKN